MQDEIKEDRGEEIDEDVLEEKASDEINKQ